MAFSPERSAGSCKNNFFDRIMKFACKTLKNSRMLRIYRINVNSFIACQFCNKLAGNYQRFFVGKSNLLSCFNSPERWF